MNQDVSICVLSENEMGWAEPFELDEVQILDTYYLAAQKSDIAFLKKWIRRVCWLDFERRQGLIQRASDLMEDGKIVCLAAIVSAII